jgi:hypothetical protein
MRASRFAFLLAALALAAGAASCARAAGAAAPLPRIVVITPSEASAPGEFRGAEAFLRDYSGKPSGGTVVHAVYPDKMKMGDASAVAAFIAESAGDPRVRAIVVAPARAGTAEGFRRAKEARAGGAKTELLCIAAGSSGPASLGEDELVIESAADLVVDLDRVYRAYLIPWAAKKMGAKSLVAAYAREEGADPAAARERAIMSAAAADLGLKYAAQIAPAGVDAAAFARAGTGAWLRDYGPDAALYCSSPALVGPILAGAIAGGGIVVDAAAEADRAAYAAALGLDLSAAKGEPGKERRLLEAAIAPLGERGRLGVWDSGYAESSVEGLGEFAMRVSSGLARKDELKDLVAALDARSQGAAWLADYDVDPDTGVRSANLVLIRQDINVLGRGYLQSALQTVPSKYLIIKAASD